jgi:hypothetical protein
LKKEVTPAAAAEGKLIGTSPPTIEDYIPSPGVAIASAIRPCHA